MSTVTEETYLTVREVAEVLRLDRKTVLDLAGAGHFAGARNFKGQAGWRIPQSSVEAFMRGGRKPRRETSKLSKSQQRETRSP